MSDAASLASALLQKLAELEQRVIEYRQDMATEFGRYADEVLRDVPTDVSAKVEGTIKDALRNFRAIGPAFEGVDSIRGDSRPTPVDAAGQPRRRSYGKGSPPPVLPHTSGVPPEQGDGRSPHAREEEFHGLFVPSFMPLINGAQKQNSQESLSSQAQADATLTASGPKAEDQDHTQESVSSLREASAYRPQPLRRLTDDAFSSSAASDDSVTKIRRSALRRSSSSSVKTQSPRRVRFEVEGGEVLPTASPPQSPRAVERSPILLGDSADTASDAYSPTYDYEEDSVGLLGSSPPRPKKISSTDRLKALARNSNEDTSQWQVVGDLQDIDDDEEDFLVMPKRNGRSSFSEERQETHSPLPPTFGQPVSQIAEEAEEDADSDGDDMLGMPQLQSFRGKKSFTSPSPPKETTKLWDPSIGPLTAPAVQPKIILPSSEKLDDEDLFDYEPNDDDSDPTPRASTPPKYIAEEEPNEPDTELQSELESENFAAQLLSTSPAITIQRPNASEPATPPSRVPMAATVGSYKGRPFTISSIKDEEVQRKAAEMGDFYSFVGSVDGRSGVDESSSYLQRPDLTYFTGTPKSLSERLMMEDLEEKRGSSNGGSDNK